MRGNSSKTGSFYGRLDSVDMWIWKGGMAQVEILDLNLNLERLFSSGNLILDMNPVHNPGISQQ